MTLRKRQLELDLAPTDGEHPRVAVSLDRAPVEAANVELVAEIRLEQRLVGRDDGDPPRRQRLDSLCVRPRDVLHRADDLEVLRADRRDERDRRSRDLAELGDLPEPAHAHLGDQHSCLRLEPEHGQREPELVVLARVRRDGRRHRCAERAERVLRRRLPGRADDRDDRRVRASTHEPREGRQSSLLVIRNERRRAGRERVLDEAHSRVQRDEEVAGSARRASRRAPAGRRRRPDAREARRARAPRSRSTRAGSSAGDPAGT